MASRAVTFHRSCAYSAVVVVRNSDGMSAGLPLFANATL
jgi:hypothetical protein